MSSWTSAALIARRETPNDDVLQVGDEGVRVGNGRDRDLALGDHAIAECAGREEEHQTSDEGQVHEEGIHRAKSLFAHALIDDLSNRLEEGDEPRNDFRVETRAPVEQFSEDQDREIRTVRVEPPEDRDVALEPLARGGGRAPDLIERLGDGVQIGEQRGDVQAPLPSEVVTDHGLVDARRRGDRVDRGAIEPPERELLSSGREQSGPGRLRVSSTSAPRGTFPRDGHLNYPNVCLIVYLR